MSLYRVTTDKLESVSETSFSAESLFERKDLQRLLRRDISPVGDDLMVIAEEYGEWEDSNRRIDLLCLSKDAGLVVVEIKRTELTTAVLWLNRRDLDITCIRLRPYRHGADVLIDVTQIIPLPESADYEVKVRAQEKEKRKVIGARQDVSRRFWAQFIARSTARTQLLANRTTTTDHWLDAGIGRVGFKLGVSLTKDEAQVECYIRVPGDESKSTMAFEALRSRQAEIEQRFGGPLEWQDLPERQGCRICTHLPGSWKSPEPEWAAIQDRMIDALFRLDAALRQPIQALML